jgi:hypothetical protein
MSPTDKRLFQVRQSYCFVERPCTKLGLFCLLLSLSSTGRRLQAVCQQLYYSDAWKPGKDIEDREDAAAVNCLRDGRYGVASSLAYARSRFLFGGQPNC